MNVALKGQFDYQQEKGQSGQESDASFSFFCSLLLSKDETDGFVEVAMAYFLDDKAGFVTVVSYYFGYTGFC